MGVYNENKAKISPIWLSLGLAGFVALNSKQLKTLMNNYSEQEINSRKYYAKVVNVPKNFMQ